jgi:hypothetical protein
MSCGLVDIACYVQTAAYEWWTGVGLLNKTLIVGGVLALVLGVSWSLLTLLKRVGGWPAALGAVAVILGALLALLPQKPKAATTEHFPDGHPDTKGAFEFGVNKTKPKKKRKTIFDK